METTADRIDPTPAVGEEQYPLFPGFTPNGGETVVVDTSPALRSAHDVIAALSQTREALIALRSARDDINREIRVLVAHERHLERMARIAGEILEGKEVNDENPPPGPD